MEDTVFDSSAVLILLFDEPAADKVEQLLTQAEEKKKEIMISSVNWAEVLVQAFRFYGEDGVRIARQLTRETPLRVIEVNGDLAELAAHLKITYKLPLADAFCAALAKKHHAALVTSDRDFERVRNQIKIIWLRAN